MSKVQCDIIMMQKQKDGSTVLLLREKYGNRRLPIIIGQGEAYAISIAIENQKMARPLTHDLAKSMLDHLGVAMLEVNITTLQKNTFYAVIVLEASGLRIDVDARPSDAIALALRSQAPIFVEEEVLRIAGLSPDQESQAFGLRDRNPEEEGEHFPDSQPPKKSELDDLRDKLKEAIKVEDFERAAKIRDKINRIENNPQNR